MPSKQIKITATHGRGGYTRRKGETIAVTPDGPSTEKTLSAHEAGLAVDAGLGKWEGAKKERKAKGAKTVTVRTPSAVGKTDQGLTLASAIAGGEKKA